MNGRFERKTRQQCRVNIGKRSTGMLAEHMTTAIGAILALAVFRFGISRELILTRGYFDAAGSQSVKALTGPALQALQSAQWQ